jgi:hypothetical protein
VRKSSADARMMDLGRLLELIHQGGLALPDFQRDFDWSNADVEALLVTVLAGWPAGSLLLMEAGREIFQLRGFEGGPANPSDPAFVLLDGQQRLTSLYQALYNKGPRVYAIKVSELEERADLEEAVVSFSRKQWEKDFSELSDQASEGLIPFYALTSPTEFFDWRDNVVAEAPGDKRQDLRHRLTSAYSDFLSSVHKYEFPVVLLERNIAPQAIARIFERVNRLGIELNTFDLMVARVFEPDWNLRKKWDEARREWPILDVFLKDDGLPVLQVVALRAVRNVRRSAVLDLDRREVHREWGRAAEGVAEAAGFLQGQCGVNESTFLPYNSLLLLFSALAADYQLNDHAELVKRVFWSKSFAQSYDVAANTRLVSDYADLKRCFETGSDLALPAVDREQLYRSSRRTHRAIWAAFTSLLEVRQPQGFLSDLLGASDASEPGGAKTFLSLFPRGLEPEVPEIAPPHLRMLSQIHGPRAAAKEIDKYGLADVLDRLAEDHGAQAVQGELAAHLLPPLEMINEHHNDWRAFFLARLDVVETAVEDLGLTVADSESEP